MKKQSLRTFIISFFCLISLICITLPGTAATSGQNVASKENRSVYYSVTSWAQMHKMSVRWTSANKKLRITKKDVTIDLTVGERCVKFNGVNVWIGYPVKLSNGRAYVAKQDVLTTLEVLVAPDRKARKVRTVVIDPGHGGKQPGAMVNGKKEKDYTLLIAKELKRILTNEGLKVVLTREGDTTLGLYERADLAQRANADLLVSIHLNAASSKSANGLEVFTTTPAGAQSTNPDRSGSKEKVNGNANDKYNLLLAHEIQKNMLNRTKMNDRGVRRDRLAVLNRATMPAVLVEAGFITNAEDQKRIFTKSERDKVAKAIAEGILNYKEKVDPR